MRALTSSPQQPRQHKPALRRWLLPLLFAVLLAGCGTSQSSSSPPTGAGHGPAANAPLAAGSGAGANVYAHDGAGMLAPAAAHAPYLLYVPESGGDSVDVVDPAAMKVIARYKTGLDPQHVVPSWDLRTLYSTNDLANTLTPFDPLTGKPDGPAIPVDDPYNMYFTPNGAHAIIVAEARQHLDFRDPHTFALQKRLTVNCPGVDHGDFSGSP